MASIRPFLWFNADTSEVARHYAEIFEGHADVVVHDGPMPRIRIGETEVLLFNGGPYFSFTPATSLFVEVQTQEEVDTLWNAFLSGGGEASQCGWLTDRFGLSWQIIPEALGRYLSDPDPARAAAAHAAMMTMSKIVIAELDDAVASA